MTDGRSDAAVSGEVSDDSISMAAWEVKLKALQHRSKADGDDWLRALYAAYLQQFLSDNNRIWTTGQLMVPLALSPLALLVSIPDSLCSGIKIVVLAMPSIALIWFWLVIAENHRALQEKSRHWLDAIERLLDVQIPGGPKARGALVQAGRIRQVRWWLASAITIAWLALFVLSFTPQCKAWMPPQSPATKTTTAPGK
jgi:hypothetical protein